MSEEENAGRDMAFIIGPQSPDGSIPALRVNEDGVTVGYFTLLRDGESLSGREVISLGKRNGPGYEVETLYDGRTSPGGPAMVNSQAFRSGWDSVFAKKADAQSN